MTAEWRHVTGRFYAFIAALAPTPEERDRAQTSAADVAKLVAQRFECYGYGDHRVMGGFAKGTAIRLARTIDLLCSLPAGLAGEAELARGPRALTPLHHDLIGVLSLRYGAVQTSREGWLSVTIGRGDDELVAVRVIPAFPGPDRGYRISTPSGKSQPTTWRHTDPFAESTNLRKADALSGGKATHLVRMLKAWRHARGIPITSFALELLAAEFVTVWTYHRRSLLFYDWMVRDFFFWVTAQAGTVLAVPGGTSGLEAGEDWLTEAWTAHEIAREASALERDNRDGEAANLWRSLFGPAFGRQPAPALPPVWHLSPATSGVAVAAE